MRLFDVTYMMHLLFILAGICLILWIG